jgi:hypothetical protein
VSPPPASRSACRREDLPTIAEFLLDMSYPRGVARAEDRRLCRTGVQGPASRHVSRRGAVLGPAVRDGDETVNQPGHAHRRTKHGVVRTLPATVRWLSVRDDGQDEQQK